MQKMYHYLLVGIWLIGSVSCSTDPSLERPDIGANEALNFPVIFHVLHSGQPTGQWPNYDAAVLHSALDHMNEHFAGAYGNNTINTNIQFRLAQKSPENELLPERGVHRMYREESIYSGEGFFEQPWLVGTMWDPRKYVNVWIAPMDDEYSWATFPYISMNQDSVAGLPTIPGYYTPEDLSYAQGMVINSAIDYEHIFSARILAHEMGHYFGLKHPFNYSDCSDHDHCDDTPDYDRDSYDRTTDGIERTACNGSRFTANNVMDYNNLQFPIGFTADQHERMRKTLQSAAFLPILKNSEQGRADTAISPYPSNQRLKALDPIIISCKH